MSGGITEKTNSYFKLVSSIVFTGLILYFGKPFLIPIAYSFMIAIVLYPMCRFFESKGMGKLFSVGIPILIVCLLFGGLITILTYETTLISSKWALLQQKTNPLMQQIQQMLENEFGWSTDEQLIWVSDTLHSLSQNAGLIVQETSKATFEALLNLFIIPVYIALILIYRKKLVNFITYITPEEKRSQLTAALNDTIGMFSKFIRGMVMVYLTVGILNTLGLWLIGVENPLMFGMLTAIMTIIPYFGIVISAVLPITLSWINTGSLWQPLGVVGVFSVVQYLEANLIFPYIVGRFVNLNTLAAIIVIFIGALFWGVSGMILFLPFAAAFRLFASHFPELKHWSDLLGK